MSNKTLAICGQAICGRTICGDVDFNFDLENIGAADYGENPKINLATGRLVYEHTSLSIGGGTYAIGLSLVYNSAQKNSTHPCGTGWKLNVQQKLVKQGDVYKYVDATGEVHTFVLFDSIDSRYYDTADAGQVLTVPTNGQAFISDGVGNKIYFDEKGNVSKTVSGINANISKILRYDTNERIVKLYDARLKFSDKIRTYLTFEYNATNGLLESITAYDKYNIACARELYEYDLTNGAKLTAVKRAAFNGNGVEIGQKTIKDLCYDTNGNLKAIMDSETRSVSIFSTNTENRIGRISFGVIQDDVPELELGGYEASGSINAITGYAFARENAGETVFGKPFIEKARNSYAYYTQDATQTYKTEVTNEDGRTTVYYLDTKYRIVSQFEKDGSSLKTLNKENGKRLTINNYVSVTNSGQNINGRNTYTVNSLEFSVSGFNLSHYGKNDNKYFDCAFWIKHNLDTERLKVKFEYKLTGDSSYRTQYVWVNGRAKNAWQNVSAIITLDEVEGSYNSSSLSALKITLCNATGGNAGSFVISRLMFNPAPKVTTSVRDGTRTFAINSVDRFYSSAYNTTYEIANNQTATDIYLTENDVVRSLMNKHGHPMTIGSYSYFDIICNDGTKRLSKAKGFVFEKNGGSCNLTNVNHPLVTETIMSTNKVKVQQYYHFEGQQFTLNVYNYYRENGMQGANSDNDHSSTSQEIYNYQGQKLSEKDEYGVTTQYSYDDWGQLLGTKTIGSDRKVGEVARVDYDENGENVKTTTSGLNSTDYAYLSPFALNSETIQNCYHANTNTYFNTQDKEKVTYGVYHDRVTQVARYNGNTSVTENAITYENGRIRTVSNGHVKYGAKHDFIHNKMEYTRFLNETETVVQTDAITKSTSGEIHTSTFNGNSTGTLATTLDIYDRIQSIAGNGATVEYTYQEGYECPATQEVDTITDGYEDGRVTKYHYNAYNNLIAWEKGTNHLKVRRILSGETEYVFGSNEKYYSRINYDTSKVMSPRITSTSILYDVDNDQYDNPVEVEEYLKNYEYDSLGRLSKKKIIKESLVSTANQNEQTYEYLKVGNSNTETPTKCTYINAYVNSDFGDSFATAPAVEWNETYSYDTRNNLIGINNTCNGYMVRMEGLSVVTDTLFNESHRKNYSYDTFNRLVSETDTIFGNRTYSYGANGKLSQVVKDGVTKPLVYNALDQLMSYNGVTYAYDGMGNRTKTTKSSGTTTYGYTRGNLLASIGTAVNYSYNAEGVRFRKVILGTTTEYYLDGNKILGEDRGTTKLRYFYDIDGLCGIRYGETNYEVVRNAYGDVVMLLKDNIPVVRYYYDAWGNCQVNRYNDTENIGNINPFRWRGHYYDSESGFYYANGSYYDPAVGLHVDAAPIQSVIDNAEEVFGLDLNGIKCNNILCYLSHGYDIHTTLELCADITYTANKPWWEIVWNTIVGWFVSLVQWYNDLSNETKIMIGVTLFALACIITVVTTIVSGGTATAVLVALGKMMLSFIIGAVSAAATSFVTALIQGENVWDAMNSGVADAIFWGGVFAFVTAGVNAVKTGVRLARARKVPRCKIGCFIAGTLVQTKEGLKPIEEIEEGELVLAYNADTGEQDYKPVKRLIRNETDTWYHIFVKGEEIVCTPGHPFYILNADDSRYNILYEGTKTDVKGKWISAKYLKTCDKVLLSDGSCAIIEKIEIEQLENIQPTYNFEVEDFHTYYVSENSVLVHNDCIGRARRKAVREAWKQERELVAKTGKGTRKWSGKQRMELLKRGKVKGFDGHHINSVKKILRENSLDDALIKMADPDNIIFLTRKEHLSAHFGNFANETTGALLSRII